MTSGPIVGGTVMRHESFANLSVLPKQKAGEASEEERVGKEGRDGATRGRKPMKKDQVV